MTETAEPPLVVAVALILTRGDRMLCMRRSAWREAGPGLWETLSGRVRPGEEPHDAALREVGEECGLAVDLDPRPVTAYAAERLGRPMVVIVYRARAGDGDVTLSDEHDDFAWLTPDEFALRSPLERLVEASRRAFATPWHPSTAEGGTDA